MLPERKLTAILAADVAGYSAMMGRDEAGTFAALKSSREAIAKEIVHYRGRVVSATGDGLLAEFASVVNAVECAVGVQRTLAERNAGQPPERRMLFRIGINLGDVMVEGDDLFGEGVNIAARLEALAEPGGIMISGAVFEQVRTKLSLGFDFVGPQPVKNISEPVAAWRVVLDPDRSRDALARNAPAQAEPPVKAMPGSGSTEEWRGPRARGRASKLQRLKRRAVLAAIPIAALFTINVLTWSGVFWFQWPTLAILTIVAIRSAWVMGR